MLEGISGHLQQVLTWQLQVTSGHDHTFSIYSVLNTALALHTLGPLSS